MIGKPIILSSRFIASGDTLAPSNPTGLYCPSDKAVLVDEFRFAFDDVEACPISLKAGRALITESKVPWNSIVAPGESNAYGEVDSGAGNYMGAANWKLSRPLYLPQQRQVSIIISREAGAVTSQALFSLRGREVDSNYPRPRTVAVPWVGVFRPASTDLNQIDATPPYKSSEMRNPCSQVLHVTKLVGMSTNPTDVLLNDYEDPNYSADPTQEGSGRNACSIRIYDGKGNPIVRDFTPLLHLCQGISNEWKVEFDLGPGEMLQTTMDLRHAVLDQGPYVIWPSIAMVGWREVAYEEVYG